jgi:hypothetical protein
MMVPGGGLAAPSMGHFQWPLRRTAEVWLRKVTSCPQFVKRRLLERWPSVNPETQTRCNKLIELEGCLDALLSLFLFFFREPPCLLQFCNDI